jgi:hypothetical protein
LINDFLLFAKDKIENNPLIRNLSVNGPAGKELTLDFEAERSSRDQFENFFGTLIVYDSIKKTKINVSLNNFALRLSKTVGTNFPSRNHV